MIMILYLYLLLASRLYDDTWYIKRLENKILQNRLERATDSKAIEIYLIFFIEIFVHFIIRSYIRIES